MPFAATEAGTRDLSKDKSRHDIRTKDMCVRYCQRTEASSSVEVDMANKVIVIRTNNQINTKAYCNNFSLQLLILQVKQFFVRHQPTFERNLLYSRLTLLKTEMKRVMCENCYAKHLKYGTRTVLKTCYSQKESLAEEARWLI